MVNLNVELEDAVRRAARISAAAEGVTLREWVKRAIVKEALVSVVDKPAQIGEANGSR